MFEVSFVEVALFVFCKDFGVPTQKRRRTPDSRVVDHIPKRPNYTTRPEPVKLVNNRSEVPKYREDNTLKTTYEWSDVRRENEVIVVRREPGIVLTSQ